MLLYFLSRLCFWNSSCMYAILLIIITQALILYWIFFQYFSLYCNFGNFYLSHVWMWELDYKESWGPKNSCFGTEVLEKTLESPLDCKEIQPVHPKGDQSWVFIGRTDVEAETPILWSPDAKKWLIGKDPDAGKDWGQEEKGTTEDEMVWWHHRLDRHGFWWTLGFGDGQGGLVRCSSWGYKELDMTEWLNWTLKFKDSFSSVSKLLGPANICLTDFIIL